MNREILYVEDRLLHPMIRRNGELERASWEEAMSLIETRFRTSIDEKGPDSIAYYGSGQLFTEESYTANKLFKAGIGTNNVDGNPRLCMASAAAGYTSVFGKDEPMGCYEDTDHADCFFITGSNMADCHPIVWERVLDRKRTRPETFVIVVDPRRTNTAKRADLHLAIRPGTDVTLYNSMIYEFYRREMEELWNVPEGSISPDPGYHTMALFQAMERGDVDCTLIMSTNPLHSLPNILPYREAMERTFIVVSDAFHPTETTRYADVILPAAMWVEKSGVFSQSERRYHYVPKLVEPPGEARSDFEILIDLAGRLGYSDLFPNRTQADIWDEWRHIFKNESKTEYPPHPIIDAANRRWNSLCSNRIETG